MTDKQCANPVCNRDVTTAELIDTSYMSHAEDDHQVIYTCDKHRDTDNPSMEVSQ